MCPGLVEDFMADQNFGSPDEDLDYGAAQCHWNLRPRVNVIGRCRCRLYEIDMLPATLPLPGPCAPVTHWRMLLLFPPH